MSDYPPGSIGEALEQVAERIEALSWYLWPAKFILRRKLRKTRELLAEERDTSIKRYLRS